MWVETWKEYGRGEGVGNGFSDHGKKIVRGTFIKLR